MTTWEELNLRGRVRALTETHTGAMSLERIEEWIFDENGVHLTVVRYECDAHGRIVTAAQTHSDPSNTRAAGHSLEIARASVMYDGAGRVAQLTMSFMDHAERTVNRYNEHGDLIEAVSEGQPPRAVRSR